MSGNQSNSPITEDFPYRQLRRFLNRLKVANEGQRLLSSTDTEVVQVARVLERLLPMDDQQLTPEMFANVLDQMEAVRKGLAERLDHATRRFGGRLEDELSKRGLTVQRCGTGLACGILFLEWNLAKRSATIWYGKSWERLDTAKPDPESIAKKLSTLQEALGSKTEPNQFLDRLKSAWRRATMNGTADYSPVSCVIDEIAFLLQPKTFHGNPVKKNFRGYSRADFSYDLFRVRALAASQGLQLKTATRAVTAHAKEFIWIPTSESVEGGEYFSGIRFVEE